GGGPPLAAPGAGESVAEEREDGLSRAKGRRRVEQRVAARDERLQVAHDLGPCAVGAGLHEVGGSAAVEGHEAARAPAGEGQELPALGVVERRLHLRPGGTSRGDEGGEVHGLAAIIARTRADGGGWR